MTPPQVAATDLFKPDPLVDGILDGTVTLEQSDAATTREERWRQRMATALDGLDRTGCRCDITEDTTLAELRAMGPGCTSPPPPSMAPGWTCPVWLKVMIAVGALRTIR